MEAVQTVPEWKATADEIWAMMRETDRRMKETDRRIEANARLHEETAQELKETDRQMRESSRRLDQQLGNLGKQFGELGNRFGEMVEYMIVPNLVEKFRELGFEVEKAHRDVVVADKTRRIFTEVDVLLENGDKVIIVEIKNKPSIGDINDHIERMEKLRKDIGLHHDQRKYRGAIAGVVFGENEKTYALKQGFYVIEPSGETFNIIEPKGGYHPREW
ncbi:MAG: hypothetical protein LBS37_07260 [Treponema sp.]|jgi:hypothetical protein|nr:hypothetical protein [Treponema sp.]